MNVLWTGQISSFVIDSLIDDGLSLRHVGIKELVDEHEFVQAMSDVTIYVCGGLETLSAKVIESAPLLRLAIFLGTDYSSYFDVSRSAEKGIIIRNTPGANAKSVAELCFCFILNSTRQINTLSDRLKQFDWEPITTHSVEGTNVFLVGCGRIGEIVARQLNIFGCRKISYWSRTRKVELERELGLVFCPFVEGIRSADVVSIHIPGNSSIKFDRQLLFTMKKNAILVNTARPSLVDPRALLEALESRHLACAVFDGFYGEGKRSYTPEEAKLLSLPSNRFFATPHIGWRTHEADRAMFDQALSIIREFIQKSGISIQ